jgi:NAD(P)-dependent dehydrogenase (short-subunit alcohol dehydrogenase family)
MLGAVHPTVITGAAAGLGRCTAEALLARGRPVVLVDRDEDALHGCVAALAARYEERPTPLLADLSSLDGARDLAGHLHGPLGGLVNNAGGRLPGEQYPEAGADRWLAALTLNLLAPMLLTQLLWTRLAEGGAGVVNVASSAALGDAPYDSPEYAAAKAAVLRLTTSLGARPEVRVTAVVPGWIRLDRAIAERAALPAEERRTAAPLVPPGEIAEAIADLLERGRPGQVVQLLGG